MKFILSILVILVGVSSAMPTAEPAEAKVEKRAISRYECENYTSATLGAIAKRKCGGVFGSCPGGDECVCVKSIPVLGDIFGGSCQYRG